MLKPTSHLWTHSALKLCSFVCFYCLYQLLPSKGTPDLFGVQTSPISAISFSICFVNSEGWYLKWCLDNTWHIIHDIFTLMATREWVVVPLVESYFLQRCGGIVTVKMFGLIRLDQQMSTKVKPMCTKPLCIDFLFVWNWLHALDVMRLWVVFLTQQPRCFSLKCAPVFEVSAFCLCKCCISQSLFIRILKRRTGADGESWRLKS